MKKFTGFSRLLLTVSLAATTAFANSEPIIVDFSGLSAPTATSDLITQGVRFSTNCHYHIASVQADTTSFTNKPSLGGNWLAFDSGAGDCTEGIYNPYYIGPPGVGLLAKMFVSLQSGEQFALTSFDFVRVDAGARGLLVESSKGGHFQFSGVVESYANFSFSGEDWSGLEWVVFSQSGPSPTTAGFDNLVLVETPEPSSTAAWLGMFGALLIGSRRSKRFPAKR